MKVRTSKDGEVDAISMSFLDVLSCGLGGTILLFIILSVMPHRGSEVSTSMDSKDKGLSIAFASKIGEKTNIQFFFVQISMKQNEDKEFGRFTHLPHRLHKEKDLTHFQYYNNKGVYTLITNQTLKYTYFQIYDFSESNLKIGVLAYINGEFYSDGFSRNQPVGQKSLDVVKIASLSRNKIKFLIENTDN